MPLNPNEICHAFKNWLTSESKLNWDQTENWTFEVKGFFGRLGKSEGYHSKYTSRIEKEKEYLCDIVWVCEKPNRYLGLAMESELSMNEKDILEDFVKLVDIKARLKIGLFALRLRADEPKILKKMENILTSQVFMLPNEVYVVIFLKYDLESKEIAIHAYELDLKGTIHREILTESHPFPLSQNASH
jgi:hypothetical protein